MSTCEQQYKRQRIPIAAVITLEYVNSKIDMTWLSCQILKKADEQV